MVPKGNLLLRFTIHYVIRIHLGDNYADVHDRSFIF